MFETANSRNAEITEVNLSIGQCKLIGRLLDEKLHEVETGTSDLSEKGLKTLIDVFWAVTKQTDSEKVISMDKWVKSLNLKGLNHG